MQKRAYGRGNEGLLMFSATSGTTPVVSRIMSLENIDVVGAQLITDAAGTGAWKVEVSNDYDPAETGGPPYGQVPGTQSSTTAASTAHWSDITSGFSPSIAAVTAASSQPIQMTVGFRAIRFTYTPATGTANAIVIAFGKSYS
jgi:hypothetical protein